MPNTYLRQLRYQQLVEDAENTSCENYRDLPALACGSCGLAVTFGGALNLEQCAFTPSDICMCCEQETSSDG